VSTEGPSRRGFLIGSVTGLGWAWLTTRRPPGLLAEPRARPAAGFGSLERLEVLEPHEATEIEAVAAQIIPTDDTPGAREAGAVYFIDRALATFDSDKREMYAKGLADLQAKTSQLFPPAVTFSELTPPQQIEVLKAIEKTSFFTLVRLHTVEGCFADSRHGGNRGKVGWKAIGFDDGSSFEPPFGFYDRDHDEGG
jgi:gluconate 2-dehydrogenase gamma chain